MTTEREFCEVLGKISYPGFEFHLRYDGIRPYLQVHCPQGVDARTGAEDPWNGRKWRLSDHMVPSEIVQTAFLALKTALEHEMREQFLYKGQRVFSPHLDLDQVAGLMSIGSGLESKRDA